MEGGGQNELADDLGDAVDESAVGSVESQDNESVGTDVTGNEEEISEDEEEEDPGVESGNTWTGYLRVGCCQLSLDLIDPATPDKRITWDPDLVEAHNRRDDLEDLEGFYESL